MKQGRIEWDEEAQREVPYDFTAAQRYFAAANAAMAEKRPAAAPLDD